MEADRDKAVAWELDEKLLCPCGCGRPATESMDKDNQRRYDAEMIRCHARAALDRRSELYQKENPDADMAGMMARLSRTPED